MSDPAKKYFTTAEVGAIFGKSAMVVINWIRRGHIKALKPGGEWLIPAEEVERILKPVEIKKKGVQQE